MQFKTSPKGETAQNRYIALVRGIFHRAERHWRWIEKSPAFALNRESKRRIRWLTQNEAVRLLNELPEHLKDMAEFTSQQDYSQAKYKTDTNQ